MLKEFFENKKLATFDLDGTTVQTEKVWTECIHTIMDFEKIPLWFDPGSTGGTSWERWETILINAKDVKKSAQELEELARTEYIKNLHKIEITEGFWSLAAELKVARKMNLALATNSCRAITNAVLKHLELDGIFDYTICFDEVKKPKPAPEMYQNILKKFNVKPNQVVAFEDSLTGAQALHNAKIKAFVVWDGKHTVEEYPKNTIGFAPNFTYYLRNMNTTAEEDIRAEAKIIEGKFSKQPQKK